MRHEFHPPLWVDKKQFQPIAQNTYEMTEKMVQAGVQFDMAIYTNRNHGIRGGNTSMHLYTKMTNFLKEQLQ